MKNYIKKTIFVCSGLFVIVGVFVLFRVENVDASTAPKETWSLEFKGNPPNFNHNRE